jgi:hypothetical protein
MTVKIKTLKTSELDINDDSAQDYLKSTYGNLEENSEFD